MIICVNPPDSTFSKDERLLSNNSDYSACMKSLYNAFSVFKFKSKPEV